MDSILNNVDLLILFAAFMSLIATGVVFNKMRNQATPHPEFGHMTGPTLLLVILTLLLFLTWLTVAVSYVDLGGLNVVVAMGVATIKASLVSLYFMHLRWDRPYNAIIFVGSLLFLGIFLGFALLDTAEYNPSLIDDPFLKIPAEQYGTEQG
ncbi:MAG: cytochrome C oxidase subunit IV family protein [Planctomycetota bacterium]|nr:cytochrome C oxidase subunit IV family protein [Planctomycetota bacterium]